MVSYPTPGTLLKARSQLGGHREKPDEKSGPLEGVLRAKVGRGQFRGSALARMSLGGQSLSEGKQRVCLDICLPEVHALLPAGKSTVGGGSPARPLALCVSFWGLLQTSMTEQAA